MLSAEMSFYLCLAASLSFAGWFGNRHGKQYALAGGMAASMLAASWFQVQIDDIPVNVTTATAIVLLAVYCVSFWRHLFKHLCLLDFVLGILVVWHCVADIYHDGQPIRFAATAYGQWMLPYASGRYIFLHKDALRVVSPVFVAVAVVISLAAWIESITSVNLWEFLFTEVDDKVSRAVVRRYDLWYRSMGPVRNPIFLGIVLLTMIPLAVEATKHAGNSRIRQAVSFISLIIIVLGVVSTSSRGPVLCLCIAALFALSVRFKTVRWTALIVLVICAGIITSNPGRAIDLLDGRRKSEVRSEVVEIDNEKTLEITNNTRHRIIIPKVYWPIVCNGGPLGYGSVDSSGFPPRNIPGLPMDPATKVRLRNVDNSFINVGLAFGWVGLASFFALFLAGIYHAIQTSAVASTYLEPSDGRLFLTCSGVFFALIFELNTIHWSYDFGFWIMFLFGAIAGSRSQVIRLQGQYSEL